MQRRDVMAMLLATAAFPCPARAADPPTADRKIGDKLTPLRAPAKDAAYPTREWDELMPPGWDPMKSFKQQRLEGLNDADPRAQSALADLKRAWSQAPVRADLDGQPIRIAGFVVPLGGSHRAMKEFLLVPYFGACIHVPPPPANQIIHVKSAKPLSGIRSMDAVWVQGTLRAALSDTAMGTSGYRLDLVSSEPYAQPKASQEWRLR
ncbi:DUF3299 domain-containing protein [Rhizobacter sp. LjRoot28]|uniref:DUF3299 domain-containing protein n=1 Tax=Rhizobacter sp. LjRoot28 TaxID=3342309 RepID=UPI003ECD972B